MDFLYNLINKAGSNEIVLSCIVATLAIATIAVLTYFKRFVPLAKYSQYNFRHLVFLQLHLKSLESEPRLL